MTGNISSSIPMPASAEMAMKQAQLAGQKTAQSAKQFEGMFYSQMIGIMFESQGVDPMFGGGQGEKMFRSLLTEQYGKLMAEGQNSPISTEVQKMLLKMQEQKS